MNVANLQVTISPGMSYTSALTIDETIAAAGARRLGLSSFTFPCPDHSPDPDAALKADLCRAFRDRHAVPAPARETIIDGQWVCLACDRDPMHGDIPMHEAAHGRRG